MSRRLSSGPDINEKLYLDVRFGEREVTAQPVSWRIEVILAMSTARLAWQFPVILEFKLSLLRSRRDS